MTNELAILVSDSAIEIVREVDNRLLGVNKRHVVEKLLVKFYREIIVLDDNKKIPCATPPAPSNEL